MKNILRGLFLVLVLAGSAGCRSVPAAPAPGEGCAYAAFLSFHTDGEGLHCVSVSPYDGRRDTLHLNRPLRRLVCLSSTYVGFLEALGAEDAVVAVSGKAFLCDTALRRRCVETGYGASLDYERILSLRPDLVIGYALSASMPPELARLQALGVPVFLLHEHLETHPLARAEYVRFFGALTARTARADSLFAAVVSSYAALRERVSAAGLPACRVLMNLPYADQWYLPGGNNYQAVLVRDAGGEVLGAVPGETRSGVISLEEAARLSRKAQVWLHAGGCRSLGEFRSGRGWLRGFPVLPVYNNTLRTNPEGGNDFWESGVVRPDRILEDLVSIFHPDLRPGGPEHYYERLD